MSNLLKLGLFLTVESVKLPLPNNIKPSYYGCQKHGEKNGSFCNCCGKHLGFVKGATIRIDLLNPLGDPKAYLIKGTSIALRKNQASKILIKKEEK